VRKGKKEWERVTEDAQICGKNESSAENGRNRVITATSRCCCLCI